MRLNTTTAAMAAALATLAWAAAARAAEPGSPAAATTVADVQKLIDDANYAGAVSAVTRLTSSANNGGGADKVALLAAKGEAQLHLKQGPQAGESFDRASKAATDPATVSQMSALALLARRSHGGAYTPKHAAAAGSPKPEPIDVIAADGRKSAMAALLDDELAADTPAITAAESGNNLPTLMKAIDTLTTLRAVEEAGTGSDEKTKPQLAAVGGKAHDLLATKLQTMDERVKVIGDAAARPARSYNRAVMGNGGMGGGPATVVKVGLTAGNVQELNGVIADADKIAAAADAFAKATATPAAAAADAPADGGGGGGNGGAAWDQVSADAKKTSGHAKDVLSADYGNGTNGNSGNGAGGNNGGGGMSNGGVVRRGGGLR